jgi:D-alanine--poly(phosphoribitol) ligase subunit 2
MTRDDVVRAIYDAVGRINELREPGRRLAASEETSLYGGGGGIDSLTLVSLIMDVEEAVNDHTGGQLVLADERAMAQRRNPFRDVRSFADYVMDRLREEES